MVEKHNPSNCGKGEVIDEIGGYKQQNDLCLYVCLFRSTSEVDDQTWNYGNEWAPPNSWIAEQIDIALSAIC